MRLDIELNGIKPLLLNHAVKPSTRGKFVTMYKTDAAKLFESQANSQLNKLKSQFRKFNNYYDREKHYLSVDYIFYMPIFTKKGLISKKSGDADGLIKYTNDVIFKHLLADDSDVIHVSSTKTHSDNYCIKATIYVRDLKTIK